MNEPLRIAVLASHGGSNLQALIDACAAGQIDGRIVLVVSNNRKAFALERARNHHIDTLVISESGFPGAAAYAAELLRQLQMRGTQLICLAGYMKMIPQQIIAAYRNKIINIHPALLPKYGGPGMYGIHVHEAVLAAGEAETGVTIHVVDEVYDNGRILAQRRVPVLPGDTPQVLQERVLASEHELYPETVARIAAGQIRLE
ncbi:MAG: phosphoribosylglycinamide formyltransferase [candidate division Zixibacteria bacterium]|nr:phosphoribosylglycinamide formyltransferase [candidate division Zixibacteria bacterium]